MTTSATTRPTGAVSGLILKATPPRAPRHVLPRPRLASDDAQFLDRPLILVQAPAGFGKTSLLAQWRREHLARGAVVAWLSADAADDDREKDPGVRRVRVDMAQPIGRDGEARQTRDEKRARGQMEAFVLR